MWFRRFIKFADAMPNSDIKVFAILPDKVISVQYICGPNESGCHVPNLYTTCGRITFPIYILQR